MLWSEPTARGYTPPRMTNDSSLLAHLSSRFTERTEDIAVEALGYILSTSEAAKTGLLSVLRSGGAEIDGLSRIGTQVTGEKRERPDLAGWDETGAERLLIEAKFWAGLTDNQPNAYLERLPRGGVLLFVAPEARLDTLWPELKRAVKDGNFEWSADADGARAADVCGRRLLLSSWKALLEVAEDRANAGGDAASIASIRQLNGLCQQQDNAAFLPLRRYELGPELPRRLMTLKELIDRIVARANADGLVSTKDLGSRLTLDGYGRWTALGVREEASRAKGEVAGACLCLHYTAWSRHRETPLWLELDEWEGTLPLEEVRKRLGNAIVVGTDGTYLVPIDLPTGVERDQVVDSVLAELRELAHRIAGVASD